MIPRNAYQIRYRPAGAAAPVSVIVRNSEDALFRARSLLGVAEPDDLTVVDPKGRRYTLNEFEISLGSRPTRKT